METASATGGAGEALGCGLFCGWGQERIEVSTSRYPGISMTPARRIGVALDIHLLYKNHTDVFAGVQQYADEAGWETTIDNWPADALAHSPPRKPAYDGIIARVSAQRMELARAAEKLGVPLVNVMLSTPAFDQLPAVFPDFAQVGRLQAEHMLVRGVRNLAFAAVEGRLADERQFAGFKATAEAAGHAVTRLGLPERWDENRSLSRRSRTRLAKWMDSWKLPVGVASGTDGVVRFIAQMCRERGWQMPRDVALIGSRNEEQLCEQARPELSSVELGYQRVGYEAARILDGLMNEGERREPGKSLGPWVSGAGRPNSPQSPRSREGLLSAGKGTGALPREDVFRASRSQEILSEGKGSGALARLPEDEGIVRHVLLPPVGVVTRESTDSFATDDPLVAEAQAFIVEQCHTALDVADVAEKVSVSAKTLQNHFARVLERTVAQEIRRVRVEKAKRKLAGSALSIHEIAIEAGFTSNARLCEVFKRDVGVSPREYRRQWKTPGAE